MTHEIQHETDDLVMTPQQEFKLIFQHVTHCCFDVSY